jgi:hypothetical protein
VARPVDYKKETNLTYRTQHLDNPEIERSEIRRSEGGRTQNDPQRVILNGVKDLFYEID